MIKHLLFLIVCITHLMAEGATKQIVKINEGVYQAEAGKDLYFIMERGSSDLWLAYQKKSLKELNSHSVADWRAKDVWRIYAYKDAFNTFEKVIKSGDFWVVYATNKPYKHLQKTGPKWYENVEMTFAVVSSPNKSFVSHLGITRGIFYKGEHHPGLALQLNGFAAKVMMQITPSIKLVILKPHSHMREVIRKAFAKHPESYWERLDKGKSPWVLQKNDEITVSNGKYILYKGTFPLLTSNQIQPYFAVDINGFAENF